MNTTSAAVRTKAGYVGQVLQEVRVSTSSNGLRDYASDDNYEIVWESAPVATRGEAIQAAMDHTASVVRGLLA